MAKTKTPRSNVRTKPSKRRTSMRRMKSKMTSGIKALAEDLRFRGELPPTPKQLLKQLTAQNEEPPRSSVRTKKADDPVAPVEKADDPTIGELLDDASELLDEKPDDPVAITMLEYGGLQDAFDFLNAKLFDGKLPNVVILLQRRAHSGGHFAPDRFTRRAGGGGYHEISLNPNGFTGQSDQYIISILLHEMTHLWQQVFGKPPSRAYHDRQWASKMESLGLMPSNTGMVGGRRTGARMSHFILPGGPYTQAFAELAATGGKLNLESTIYAGGSKAPKNKTKYTCPSCGLNLWGNIADADISCNPCRCVMPAERPAVQSYDAQQAAE